MNRSLLFAGAFIVLAALAAFYILRTPAEKTAGKVLAASYPAYFFAKEIAGDRLTIENVTPADADAHIYEPSPRQLADIAESRLVLSTGSLEPWTKRAEDALTDKSRLFIVGDVESDSHIWLSPQTAKTMVGKTLEGLTAAEPGGAYVFELNANALINNLEQLDAAYKEGLANCKRRDFIVTHPAFSALAQSYGLTQIPMSGAAGADPTPADLSKIAAVVKNSDIRYVFYSSDRDSGFAKTIADESGARALLLDPIENVPASEAAAGSSYLTKMRDNLANLRTALECR